MIIYFRSGGKLREKLNPDVDEYTRKIEVAGSLNIQQILDSLKIPAGLVAFAFVNGHFKRLDYQPQEGEIITLQPPVSGG